MNALISYRSTSKDSWDLAHAVVLLGLPEAVVIIVNLLILYRNVGVD